MYLTTEEQSPQKEKGMTAKLTSVSDLKTVTQAHRDVSSVQPYTHFKSGIVQREEKSGTGVKSPPKKKAPSAPGVDKKTREQIRLLEDQARKEIEQLAEEVQLQGSSAELRKEIYWKIQSIRTRYSNRIQELTPKTSAVSAYHLYTSPPLPKAMKETGARLETDKQVMTLVNYIMKKRQEIKYVPGGEPEKHNIIKRANTHDGELSYTTEHEEIETVVEEEKEVVNKIYTISAGGFTVTVHLKNNQLDKVAVAGSKKAGDNYNIFKFEFSPVPGLVLTASVDAIAKVETKVSREVAQTFKPNGENEIILNPFISVTGQLGLSGKLGVGAGIPYLANVSGYMELLGMLESSIRGNLNIKLKRSTPQDSFKFASPEFNLKKHFLRPVVQVNGGIKVTILFYSKTLKKWNIKEFVLPEKALENLSGNMEDQGKILSKAMGGAYSKKEFEDGMKGKLAPSLTPEEMAEGEILKVQDDIVPHEEDILDLKGGVKIFKTKEMVKNVVKKTVEVKKPIEKILDKSSLPQRPATAGPRLGGYDKKDVYTLEEDDTQLFFHMNIPRILTTPPETRWSLLESITDPGREEALILKKYTAIKKELLSQQKELDINQIQIESAMEIVTGKLIIEYKKLEEQQRQLLPQEDSGVVSGIKEQMENMVADMYEQLALIEAFSSKLEKSINAVQDMNFQIQELDDQLNELIYHSPYTRKSFPQKKRENNYQ